MGRFLAAGKGIRTGPAGAKSRAMNQGSPKPCAATQAGAASMAHNRPGRQQRTGKVRQRVRCSQVVTCTDVYCTGNTYPVSLPVGPRGCAQFIVLVKT